MCNQYLVPMLLLVINYCPQMLVLLNSSNRLVINNSRENRGRLLPTVTPINKLDHGQNDGIIQELNGVFGLITTLTHK